MHTVHTRKLSQAKNYQRTFIPILDEVQIVHTGLPAKTEEKKSVFHTHTHTLKKIN